MSAATYTCASGCADAQRVTLAAARRHARTAPPVWNPGRQTFVSHGLERDTVPARTYAVRVQADGVRYAPTASRAEALELLTSAHVDAAAVLAAADVDGMAEATGPAGELAYVDCEPLA